MSLRITLAIWLFFLSRETLKMLRTARWIWVVPFLTVMVLIGCGKAKPTGSGSGVRTNEDGVPLQAENQKGGKASTKQIVPVNREPKSIEGNWVMVLTLQGKDNYVWIVELKKEADGKLVGKVIDSTKDKLNPVIEEASFNDTILTLKIKNTDGIIDFQGHFDGRAIRGTLANGLKELYTARLLNTSETSLAEYVDSAGLPASDVFQKAIVAMKDKPNVKEIIQLCVDNRFSPMSLDVLNGLLSNLDKFTVTDGELIAIANENAECARLWGPRMVRKVELSNAEFMINARRLPEVALDHLRKAEEAGASENEEEFKKYTNSIRDVARVQINLARIQSKAESDRAEAQEELKTLLAVQTYNAEIMQALAIRCVETKEIDAAIGYYSDIVALPLLEGYLMSLRSGQPPGDPTPSDLLQKLWVEKNGSEEGLEEHLKKHHFARIEELIQVARKKWTRPENIETGDHSVLIELFTGAQCPPCVAADLSLSVISAEYKPTDVIVLRYHQHVPGPDGLTSPDGEDRFAFYESSATPTIALDGMVLNPQIIPFAGPIQYVPTAYNMIRQFVDERRKQSTPIRLQLKAEVEGEQLSISATVTGATEEQLPSLRLRLALAEEVVEARMPNGIRRHEMIVREMPGGARGLAPKKGELKFSYSMPAADLQQHLTEYLQRYEAGKKLEFPAEMKPPIRGPLHLVGWVQSQGEATDGNTPQKVILQTAIVPVTGWKPVAGSSAAETKPADNGVDAPAKTQPEPPAPKLPE